jgi:hypothetical protein
MERLIEVSPMICHGCSGSGACDPCDGYGTFPDSYPNAGDGVECEICTGDGVCVDCGGTSDTTTNETNAAAFGKASAR